MARLQAARLVEVVGCLLLVGKQSSRDVEQPTAGFRQLDAPAAAHEQLHAELLLQRLHLGCDRRLADAELARGDGEAQALSHCMEGSELGMPHIDFLNGMSNSFE